MTMAARMARLTAEAAATQSSSGTGVFNADGVQVSSNVRRQTAVIYDVLSEGPIEGLVAVSYTHLTLPTILLV